MKATNYHLFDFMDFDPSLQGDERLWKAYAPTVIEERDGDIHITIPFQCQLRQEDMAPDTDVPQQSHTLIIRAYAPDILRLFISMTGDEMTEHDEMLTMQVERVPLHLEGNTILGPDNRTRALIDLSAPVLDHWSDLLPAPQSAPFITFYPDGNEQKGVSITIQVVEQLIVGFEALAETDTWIEDDLLLAVSFQGLALLLEKVHHSLVNVVAEGVLVHGLRCAYTVHQHIRDVVFADIGQHLRIEEPTRDIVDEVGTFVDASFCYILPKGVDGNEHFREGFSDGFQDGYVSLPAMPWLTQLSAAVLKMPCRRTLTSTSMRLGAAEGSKRKGSAP